MKKLLIALITVLGLTSQTFASNWHHINLKTQNSYLRISYQKETLPATYGRFQGATVANNLYIDLYQYSEIPTVKIINKQQERVIDELEAQFIVDNENHIYTKINLPFGGMAIEYNGKLTQVIELRFSNHTERFEVNMMN